MGLELDFNRLEYLAMFAGSFAIISGVIQLRTIYKNKSAEDISMYALIGAIISTVIWIFYHYKKHGGGPFITTSITLIFLCISLSLKIYYDYNIAKPTKPDQTTS